MPTPSENTAVHPLASPSALARSIQAHTCPVEDDKQASVVDQAIATGPVARLNGSTLASVVVVARDIHLTDSPPQLGSSPLSRIEGEGPTSVLRDPRISPSPEPETEDSKKDGTQFSSPIPIPSTKHSASALPQTLHTPDSLDSPLKSHPRLTSSFLRNGSKFVGTQQSDRQKYNVEVDIKYVDMSESYICGYLRIEGLTADHPTLTTYFEGEIIGNKYSFRTRHPTWGSNEKVDMQHWSRFPAWRPLAQKARKPDFSFKDFADKEHIFMRWKEAFLVPDHRVRSISGASFEGFYYICFNQKTGTVSGIYFHSKSEKFQQLELCHVNDKGCFGAMEFR